MEENKASRFVSGGVLAAIAGAAMLFASSGPSAAFTLSAPSLEHPVAAAGVRPVWWDDWGHWHPNRWWWRHHHPYYYGHHRHCWINHWGYRHCRWW